MVSTGVRDWGVGVDGRNSMLTFDEDKINQPEQQACLGYSER